MKPPECSECALLNCPGPVHTEFSDEQVDAFFVGEAPGRVEIEQRRPMVGWAGQTLRHSLKHMDILRYAIGNIWRCRPSDNKLPDDADWTKATYCRNLLHEELSRGQKLVVPLGETALRALTNVDVSITSIQGHLFSSNGRVVMPMFHPSYVRRHGSSWTDWERCFDKLKLFVDTGRTHYISYDDRMVYKAKTEVQALRYLERLRELKAEYKVMSCDIETSAGYVPWAGAEILSIAIGWTPTQSIAMMWDLVDHGEAFDLLKSLLEDPNIIWLWYNGPFDTQHLRKAGIEPRIDRDAMLETHLLDERDGVHALKRDSGLWLDAPDWEWDIKQYAPGKEDDYRVIPEDKLLVYNGMDTNHTTHLSEVVRPHLELEGLTWYCDNVLVPAYNMLARARYVGFRADVRRIQELQGKIQPVMDELEHQLVELTGNPFFNPNSWQDKLKALHERGIMVPNTRKETLEEYTGDELIDGIRAFMDASKIKGTYLDGVVDDIYDDLRAHPDWKLPAETGRLRCQDPNMLGMPRKAEEEEHRWKRFVKEIWIADPDTLLMHIDRKGSEFRCCLFLADEQDFMDTLRANPDADIHGEFALMIYGPDYSKEQRVYAKMVVFGIQNNREAPSIARQFTAIERAKARKEGRNDYHVWTVREAQTFINKFFARVPKVPIWKKAIMIEALSTGKLTSFLGRIRRFGLVDEHRRKGVENEAVNFPISCLSNDLNLLSCTATMKQFGKYGVEVLVPIHDAGLLRIPKDSIYLRDEIQGMWEELPTKYLHTDLPFPCDVTMGERWSDL